MLLDSQGDLLAVSPSEHPEIGDLLIQDDGDELTVDLGRVTTFTSATN